MRYFGTDGMRGRVGQGQITPEFFVRLGWSLGRALRKRKKPNTVVIGKDTRISGYMLETALQSGLISAGVNVLLLGPMPTPGVAWLTTTLHADAGLVISASHNPYYDNGLKIFDTKGQKISDELIAEVEENLGMEMDVVAPNLLGKVERINDANGRYIEHCKSLIEEKLDLGGLKIAVDCAHGATYNVAPRVFSELGAEVIVMGASPDGLNINEKCGSTSPANLRRLVGERGADLGITFDGDGDRVLFVDHRGDLVDGDQLLYLLAMDSKKAPGGCAGVVGTEMSNMGLEHSLKENGIPFVRARVGDRYVHQLMCEKKYPLGGESSGHIICRPELGAGDGLATALFILDIIQRSGKKLNELAAGMPHYFQELVNVPCERGADVGGNKKIEKACGKIDAEKGMRVLLRASGTEPVIRVMVEGEDHKKVKEQVAHLAELVKEVLAS